MKQVTYQMRGMVTEAMIPAITASCESLAGVKNVSIRVGVPEENISLIMLTLDGEPTPDLERDLTAIMNAKGLELSLPALGAEETARIIVANVRRDAAADRPIGHSVPETNTFSSDRKPEAERYVPATPEKRERKVSLAAAVSTVITAVIIAILATFAITSAYIRSDVPHTGSTGQGSEADAFAELDVIDRLFRSLTMQELDDEALLTAVLKGYVAATGDVYAEYFTAEEFAEQTSSQNGEMCGIGISVVNSLITVEGVEYQAIVVANVYADSPAEEAGVMPGDAIMYVGVGDDRVLVNSIGYTEALNRLKGEENTECAFTVYRRPRGDDTAAYEPVEITAVRRKFTTHSVMGHVCETDPTVGVVEMISFDNTTAPQFTAVVDELRAAGCTYFVFDLRNNPGGLLTAVEDVLVYFLQEGDLMISTKDNAGNEEKTYLTVSGGKVTCGSGDLTAEDVGKYRNLTFAVLVNEYSASAAELFTANIRDYGLGKVVGVTTYGKGSMQTTYSLTRYGYDGALKLTTRHYFPPCGEGYDGIGITPDVEVELSEEALKYNINLLPEELDNQLQEAIRTMK